jgi:hypothetical protein
MSVEVLNFPNIGFLKINLLADQITPILQEILEIKENFALATKANQYLIGNIKKEYKIKNTHKYINDLVLSYTQDYENSFKFLSRQDILSESRQLVANNIWVNFQEKHEFNPVHDHSGILSFVFWIKIPYKMQDETKNSPGLESSSPLAGHFCFYYTNALGEICHYSIPADQSMENCLLIFPSRMNHSVYPFYTSDEYRISVSGNLVFQV